jgi:fructosamine-3-kinase
VSELEPRLAREAGSAVVRCRPIGGEHGARHYRASLADGRDLFVKEASGEAGRAALAAETRGLRWLAEAAAVPIPAIIAAQDGLLALAWVQPATPDREASERFGRDLARLHAAGVGAGSGAGSGLAPVPQRFGPRFGAPWSGFIASLALPNTEADEWPRWYAENRLLPYLRLARDSGALGAKDSALVESVASRVGELAGPAEPPSRIHGDLWSGNLMWSDGRGWLIDPAAHGGHRETDLAMLALFGAPFLDRILAAYREVTPLADGWKKRVPLHQLHPLLVHVCLFGRAYRDSTLAAARAALRA